MENYSSTLLNPHDTCQRSYQVGIKKANNKPLTTRLLAFMAGSFVALAAVLSAKINTVLDPGIGPFIGAIMFCMGLMLVIIAGGELFTGNILLFGGYLNKDISLRAMAVNWTRVYIWNFIGAIFVSILHYYFVKADPAVVEYIHHAITGKVTLNWVEGIGMGFLCNFLVCLAVWVSFSANDGISKFVLMTIPTSAFILLKYEHSVANMFYFSFGMLTDHSLTLGQVMHNMIPVTIGNILGGMFIAGVYHYANKK